MPKCELQLLAGKEDTVNSFNFAAIKFCVFNDSKFYCFKNLLFF